MYLKLLDSEKHPLKPEEMLPPEQQPLEIRDPEAAEKKNVHRRRYYKRKKKTSNDKGLPEKGA